MQILSNGNVGNSTSQRACWSGQAGGLEGLRQKGWSVLNLLVIEKESTLHHTAVKTLAQGDNQVICTQFVVNKAKTETELKMNIQGIVESNKKVMSSIEEGTRSLGLIINKNETLQSSEMLIYGKKKILFLFFPIFFNSPSSH